MKKFLRISFILLLSCLLLISATACGGTSAQQDEQNAQERTVAPKSDTENQEDENPECPKCPDNPECPDCPECPECPKIPRCPKRGITRLPHMRMYDEDDEIHEGVPVPHEKEENEEEHGKHRHGMQRPPIHAEPAPQPLP